jgi:hypothetical protein
MMESITGGIIRILALLVGAALCYLGFQLFRSIPVTEHGAAELSGAGGYTIKLTRIGPGIFFALFGTLIVIWCLNSSLSFIEKSSCADGAVMERKTSAATPDRGVQTDGTHQAQRNTVEQEIIWLNRLASVLTSEQVQRLQLWPDVIVPDIKRRLMVGVWDDDQWGDRNRFVRWLNETGGLSEPDERHTAAAAAFFNQHAE